MGAAAGAPWPGPVDYLSYPVAIAKGLGLRAVAWFEYGTAASPALCAAQPSWCIGESGGRCVAAPVVRVEQRRQDLLTARLRLHLKFLRAKNLPERITAALLI